MKKTAVLLILSWIQYIYSPVSAQVFQGTPPAEWIEVSGEASIKLPQEEKLEHQELLRLAQQTAIENQFGTSIVYGNFMKTYESELQHYEYFVDMKSQFAQGVWCSDKTEPVFTSRKTEILGADRKGNFKKKIPAVEWTCAVNGYAKQLHQILPRFEFKILNDKKNVVVEQKIGLNGSELIAGQDSVFHQGDLFITQFRSSKSGHLALFMDNGEKAQRMLPYYILGKALEFIDSQKKPNACCLIMLMIMWTTYLSKQINGTHSLIYRNLPDFQKRILMNWN